MLFNNSIRSLVTLASIGMVAACSAADGGGTGPLEIDGGVIDGDVTGDAGESHKPKPGICEKTTHDVSRAGPPVCTPGDKKVAYCAGASNPLSGTRTCLGDGLNWSRATCPVGKPLNQEATLLVITRNSISNHGDFDDFVGNLASNGGMTAAVMTLDDILRAFPAVSVQESMRRAEQHAFFNELRELKMVVFDGRPVYWRLNQTVNSLAYSWEMPLWYDPTTPGTDLGDSPLEEYIPTLMPFAALRQPWQAVTDSFWTPVTPDVRVGYLPNDGSTVNCDDGSCSMSDLHAMALKLRMWREKFASKPLVQSEFDGFACDQHPWRSFTAENAQLNMTQSLKYHDCSNGETGNAWDIAKADGAKYYSYYWHGWYGGSSILDTEKGTGYAMAGSDTRFPGPIYAFSCSTGAPDEDTWSLGQRMLQQIGAIDPETGEADPAGVAPIAYAAYDRTLIGDMIDPMKWAVVKGRKTLGDIIAGTMQDRLHEFSNRMNVRAVESLFLYGPPNIEVIPDPAMSVRALAERQNDDGTVDVCVEVNAPSDVQSGLLVGNRKVSDLDFGNGWSQKVAVTMTAEEAKNGDLIHLDACHPEEASCRAGSHLALRELPMHCGNLVPMADGTFDLDITTPTGQAGEPGSMRVEAVAVTMKCDGGIRSSCFADVWSKNRKDTVLDSVEVPVPAGQEEAKMVSGVNRFNFRLQTDDFDEGYRFRAMKFRLVGISGSEIGSCYARVSQADAIDYAWL